MVSLYYNRWKVDYGKAWEHLGGDVFGQTQISYSSDDMISTDSSHKMTFNHPIDMHFAMAGLQVTYQYKAVSFVLKMRVISSLSLSLGLGGASNHCTVLPNGLAWQEIALRLRFRPLTLHTWASQDRDLHVATGWDN